MRAYKQLSYVVLGAVIQTAQAESAWTSLDAGREAYASIYQGVDRQQLEQAQQGRNLFRQSWVIAPAKDVEIAGSARFTTSCPACPAIPKTGAGNRRQRLDKRCARC